MAVPRPVLLALLGLALCAGVFVVSRGAHDPGGAVTAAPTPAQAPAAKKPATAHKPQSPSKARHEAAPAQSKQHRSEAPAKSAPRQAAKSDAATKADVVNKALARGDVVVFFFTRPGPADDTATRQAVDALSGVHHVTVIRAGLEDLTAYRPVLSGAGVSQVPAVVVVKKGAEARLIQGFVDGGTLRQSVADALR